MSSAAASWAAEPRETLRLRLRRDLTAFRAVLHRDAVAQRRGSGVLLGRAAIVVLSSAALLGCFATSEAGQFASDVAKVAVAAVLLGIMTLALLLLPGIAASSLRREREAGMLDLLLLAGIRPGVLAAARTISVWTMFCSLATAALPALVFFWFFRTPELAGLLRASAHLGVFLLAVASVGVAISAWTRHAGYAVALGFIAAVLWGGLDLWLGTRQWPSTGYVIVTTLIETGMAGMTPVSPAGAAASLAAHAAIGAIGLALSTAGLSHRRPAVQRDVLRERIEKRPRPVPDSHVLTWLLQRRSAPAQPRVQALFVVPLAAVAFAAGPEASLAAGALLLTLGLFATLALAATLIAPERERRTWESLLSTRLTSEAIVRDLLRSVAIATWVPMVAGTALAAWGFAGMAQGASIALFVPAAVLPWWAFTAIGALAASACSRRTSVAIGLAAALILLTPPLSAAASVLADQLARSPLDAGGIASWLALLAASAFGSTWLVLRASWRSVRRVVPAVLPTLLVALIPLSLEDGHRMLWLSPIVMMGAAGIVLLVQGLRRGNGTLVLSGLVLAFSCALMPFAGMGLDEEARAMLALGLAAVPTVAVISIIEAEVPAVSSGIVLALAQPLALTWAVLALLLPRLGRWLGRS